MYINYCVVSLCKFYDVKKPTIVTRKSTQLYGNASETKISNDPEIGESVGSKNAKWEKENNYKVHKYLAHKE